MTGSPLDGYTIGGLVGENGGAITYSWASGNVTDLYGFSAGGLVGDSQAVIDHSYATGTVTGRSGNNSQLGGLVGEAQDPVTNSYATGSVVGYDGGEGEGAYGGLVGFSESIVSTSYATGSVAGVYNANVGGLVGRTEGSTLSNTFATGAVSAGTGSNTGGLVGRAEYGTTISVSYAMGSVSSGSTSNVGGLVGDLNSGSITDTYSRGSVNGADSTSSTGGLVGYIEPSNTVSNSYSSGAVLSTGALTGGLVGNNAGRVTTSYWDNQASGFPTIGVGTGSSTGITGLTTAQLQSGGMPEGFNATNTVWVAPAGVYPYFGWQGPLIEIQGTAFNGPSAIGSAGVGVLWNGSEIASATTQSSGYYGVGVPQNMTTGGVLTYLTSGGVANTFSDGTGPDLFLNMDLQVGALSIINAASTTLSGLTNALAAAIGNNTGPNFLYTVSNGLLSVNSGAAFQLANYSSFTFDQPLTVPGNILIEDLQSVTIANSSPISAGAGDHILIALGLEDANATFTNNAGATALNVSEGGNWDVYSVNPANDTTGGLAPAFLQYNAAPLSTPAQSGNGLLYTIAPLITAYLIGSVGKTYDGTTAATLSAGNVAGTGMINGDTVTFTMPSGAAYATANVGTGIGIAASGVEMASASHGGIPVYGYVLDDTPVNGDIGTINPATLTYVANSGSRAYGAGNPALSGTVTGFVDDQTLATATSGTAAFTSSATASSNVGAYAINGSGLTADNGNYVFTQADANSSALTINPATLIYTATPVNRTYGTSNPIFSGTVAGFVDGQTLASATTGTAVFTGAAGTTSPTGNYAIDGSGLTADHGNYVFTQAAANANALTVTAAVVSPPPTTPPPTPPAPTPTALTFVIGNAAGLQNSKPTFSATYTSAVIKGLDIASILSGLMFTITPSLSGPGTYTITATGSAPAGYSLNIAPATLTVIGSTPATLPTEAPVISPVVPELLPNSAGNDAASLLQPLNSVGLFQVNVSGTGNGFGASFIGFGSQQAPLAQSAFFGTNDKKDTYSAGAKP